MPLYESGQMYLESIFVLTKKHGNIRSVDVSEYMGFSKPSVSRAVSILRSEGYVSVDAEGYLSLTPAGLEVANKIYERHTLINQFLLRLGVDPQIAEEDACKIEHAISDASFLAMKRFMENLE